MPIPRNCSEPSLPPYLLRSNFVEYEVLKHVVMKSTIFWDITLCTPLEVNRRFGGTYHLYLQLEKMSRARYRRESR
jgi:hypothetical protein